MISFSAKAIKYFLTLKSPVKLPTEIQIINPYHKPEVEEAIKKFYAKYYDDNKTRIFILGINPGRFGGGLTGISFTDPVALREECSLENDFGNKKELSSEFIYMVIKEYGGTGKFFLKFFLSAVYSLAILKDGKNYNYYDDRKLLELIKPTILTSIKSQVDFGANRKIVILLGRKNGDYLKRFNEELNLFERIEVLDHPRYIMQYRRKFLNKFIDEYLRILSLTG